MLHLAFSPTPRPILFRSSLRLSCDNISPHKFKDYSMVKMDIDVRVANATVYAMEVLPPKGQPFLKRERIPMDVIFKPWVPCALESTASQHIEKGVNPAPPVLAKTIILLNFTIRKGDGHFLGCTQLLFVWMKSHFRYLYKHLCQVFVPLTRPIEEFLKSEWPPNQSFEEWVQNLSTLTYQEIEWRAPWMIQSTILIGCSGHL
ncbi:hypothetical protein PVK06_048109 [Gossypium arboreum]|uniref:DUF7745 domain-containing protein n=1 Tax=Gossypium arboreum TaxID=29729 RepID=A0ABR0MH15_GOSAR|nr:hypothetical protein PVK06_048109 [Gossypium arboreum]